MRPLTVVTGVLLGSCLAITAGLGAVLLIFLVLDEEYPRLAYEFRALLVSLSIFAVMTAISALSFYWLLINHRFRWPAQVTLWAGLLATGYYYWP